jgi:hypothetical protein
MTQYDRLTITTQHISNTIWGMAKMDSSWDLIPGKNLEKALNRAAKLLTPQEVLMSLHSDIVFYAVFFLSTLFLYSIRILDLIALRTLLLNSNCLPSNLTQLYPVVFLFSYSLLRVISHSTPVRLLMFSTV